MPQPTTNVFERREDLGLRFDEFDLVMNRLGFVGHRMMPLLSRSTPSGKFPRVKVGQYLQNLATQRNPDGSYNRSTREFSDDNFETKEHGLEAPLDDRTIARYDDLIDAEAFEGEVIENSLLTAYEQEVAALLFNATTFSGHTAAITDEWDDYSHALPVTNANTAISAIRLACGVKPNVALMNDVVFRNAIRCDEVINTLKYQGFQDARAGEISKQALAISLNVDEVIVADGLYNTKMPGVDAVLADIWSNEYVLFARVATGANPNERCIGRTIMWDQESATGNGGQMGVIAETYYEDARRGGVLRRRTDWGLKTLMVECGYLFSNATT
jgi:hypothetical protein